MPDVVRPDALRPERLAEFGGQPDLSAELQIVLGAAAERGELPDHILLFGPPGLGKTTLATIVAAELGLPILSTSGPALDKPGDIASLLTSLNRPTVLFIDEIHRMPRPVEEHLYSAMEDGVLDVQIGEGAKARVVRLQLEPFVLVGATTQAGLLTAPLRDRFGFHGRLELYDTDDLTAIVLRSARLLELELSAEAAAEIARRSRGTPRVANKWLRRVRDFAQTSAAGQVVDLDLACTALDAFRIDRLGLDSLGRDILLALINRFHGGPVGLATLAASVGEAPASLEEVYEPFLMRAGLLARTPRGRVAQVAAYEHLGLTPPALVAAKELAAGGAALTSGRAAPAGFIGTILGDQQDLFANADAGADDPLLDDPQQPTGTDA